MTVHQLIDELSKLPPEVEVIFDTPERSLAVRSVALRCVYPSNFQTPVTYTVLGE